MFMEKLRQGAGGWIAKIFLGLLILSFGVWGIADVFRGIGAADVAVIGSTKIGTEEFRRRARARSAGAPAAGARPRHSAPR